MNQPQREALLDLLHLATLVDSHLSLNEDDALHSALEAIGWEGAKPREIYTYSSLNRARKASENEAQTAEYVAARTAAFTDAATQEKALGLIQSVLAGDGISPEESQFLQKIKGAFPRAQG